MGQCLDFLLVRVPAESPCCPPVYIAANPIITATDADRIING